MTGTLSLDRREAVMLTGRLFSLRVEVNLVSNVLGECYISIPEDWMVHDDADHLIAAIKRHTRAILVRSFPDLAL